ncbi:MAG: hypothetical protein QOD85_1476 [Gaiellaceae bacterium]|nr:hypothetical protein [Gaiellaceae bacterium]
MKTLAAVVALAACIGASGAGAATQGFSFGRSGGNIRPLEARISVTGRVVVDNERRGLLSSARLRALRAVVARERFTALPARIVCKGVLPDIATRHVSTAGKVVSVHGGCSARFNHVYDALARAAGIA